MSTPITDAASIRGNMTLVETYAALREVASRLETDRAALMEALETWLKTEDDAEDYFVSTGLKREPDHPVVAKARETLSAARANFPTT